MITKTQALTADHFHYGECTRKVGPRGGVKERTVSVRRNGQTQTWKTRPDEFRVPIKHGLYSYGEITHRNAGQFHVADDCPLRETFSPSMSTINQMKETDPNGADGCPRCGADCRRVDPLSILACGE